MEEKEMEKKKTIKIRFMVAVIIIELFFLISMLTIYYIYHLADNKRRIQNNSSSSLNIKKQNYCIGNIKDFYVYNNVKFL